MNDRLISGQQNSDDTSSEFGLRPISLKEYVGQDKVKENLSIAIEATQSRKEPLEHALLYGPPGLGKTTLAHIIAKEMDVNIKVTSGPAIERAGDIAAIITKLKKGEVLFIDEIHRLSKVVEEILYPAMEDFTLSWVMGEGLKAQNINLNVEPFTLICATTRFGMVGAPLRDRFGLTYRLDFYDQTAMELIIKRSCGILGVLAEESGIRELAKRSRGTPRVANRLLRRVRDYAEVVANGKITDAVAKEALGKLEVDSLGLDDLDNRILRALTDKFEGNPVGLDTLAASVTEDPDTIMDVHEPYLLQLGFIKRTPRGRIATKRAFAHLGIQQNKPGDLNQLNLWTTGD